MSVTPLIQMFMLAAAALILLLCHVKASDVPGTPIFRSGMVSMIALFGIAWMADTFIANNEDAIVEALGGLAENWPFMIAVAIFLVAGLTTSQSAATRTMVPLGLALGIGAGYMIAMWTAVVGVLFLPANGTQIAAAEADTTGTTTLGKRVIDHSFQLPLQVCWIVTALVGIVIVWLFFGDQTPAPPVPRRRLREMSVRGAAFLGIGAMVGAGHLRAARRGRRRRGLGRLALVPARRRRRVAARLHRRQARRPLPVLGRAVRLPDAGLRERAAGRHRLLARLLRRDRDRLLDGRGLLRELRDVALRRRRRRRAPGTTSSRPRSSSRWCASTSSGSSVVDKAQSLIVIVLLGVFAVFIAVTIVDIDFDLLAFSGYPRVSDIVASVALTFFAYLGFSVITFAAGDLRDPDSRAAEGDVRARSA